MDVLLAGGIFLVAYALIASERFDRTLVALLGGLLVVMLGIIDQEEAFAGIVDLSHGVPPAALRHLPRALLAPDYLRKGFAW